jgi:hypothetical protein
MTGPDLCVNKPHKSRSYLNHLLISKRINFSDLIVFIVKFGPTIPPLHLQLICG